MRWVNHKIVTVSTIYALTGGVIAAFTSMSTSHLPDLLEMRGVVPHRTITHWFALWMTAVVASLLLLLCFKSWSYYLLFYAVVGGFCHVVQDFLSISGVPFGSPAARPFGLGLYKTRGEGELITVAGFVAVFFVTALMRGFFSQEHIRNEIESVSRMFSFFLQQR